MPLQIRRGTQAERLAMSQPLAQGELLYVTDDKRLYIGDNATLGGIQITGYTNEDAVDAAAAALVAGTHSGITFTYGAIQDTANRIDATVSISQLLQNLNLNGFNITGTGNINISGTISGDLKGSIFADNSTRLIDGTNGQINLDGTISGNIIPTANEVYDIGSSSFRFRDLYLSGSSIELGAATITATGSAVNLPAGSTVGGQLIAFPTSESLVVDIQGSVFGDDSSIIVDGLSRNITGSTISGDQFVGAGLTVDLQFTDQVQERLTVRSVTDGTLAGQGLVLFRNYKGVDSNLDGFVDTPFDDPLDTVADDYLGGFSIDGYNSGDYVNAASVFAKWDSNADFNFASPTATITFATGNNSNSFPNFMTFNGQGVLNAPVIKASSYATGSLPTAPEAGWIVFDSTVQKFKGYVDDTGLAAGGPSNSTPGWVDLH